MKDWDNKTGWNGMDWRRTAWMLISVQFTSARTPSSFKMSVQHKIFRTANALRTPPDETEVAVAQAIIDLENSAPELKGELRPLQISAAREVDVRGGKKAIVIFVPVPQLKAFHKVQQR